MADTIVKGPDKVCPECGVSLEGYDLQAHALTHWNDYLDPAKSSKEAIKRKVMLLKGGVSPEVYSNLHKQDD